MYRSLYLLKPDLFLFQAVFYELERPFTTQLYLPSPAEPSARLSHLLERLNPTMSALVRRIAVRTWSTQARIHTCMLAIPNHSWPKPNPEPKRNLQTQTQTQIGLHPTVGALVRRIAGINWSSLARKHTSSNAAPCHGPNPNSAPAPNPNQTDPDLGALVRRIADRIWLHARAARIPAVRDLATRTRIFVRAPAARTTPAHARTHPFARTRGRCVCFVVFCEAHAHKPHEEHMSLRGGTRKLESHLASMRGRRCSRCWAPSPSR